MNNDILGRPVRQRRHLNENEVARAFTLLQEGRSQRYVAQLLQISQPAIHRLLNRVREIGVSRRRPYTVRQRITTPREDRHLVRVSLQERFRTASHIRTLHFAATGRQISTQTVRRRLHEGQLHSRSAATAPELTPGHRRARRNFAQEHLDWDMEQWGHVLFSDESRFCLRSNDARQRVYRRRGERFIDPAVRERRAFGGGSVMVWGGITLNGRTALHVLPNGTLTARRYIDEILQPIVVPFAQHHGPDFIFQQDNARPHTARIVQNFFEEQNLTVLEWPANSPDMNPIEHLWDILKRQLRQQGPPNTLEELAERIQQAWNDIPQDQIGRLIQSMPRRCAELMQARGGHTHY